MRVVGELSRSGKRDDLVRRLTAALGGEIIEAHGKPRASCDIFIRWGMRKAPWEQTPFMGNRGAVSICLDRAYWDCQRFDGYAIQIQGVHGLSMAVDAVKDMPTRWHPELQPWKTDGDWCQILAPGWSPGHLRTPDHNLSHSWLDEVCVNATEAFGKPSRIRWHPRALPEGCTQPESIEDSFKDAFVTVSYMSNASVQSVIAGVPSVVMHPRAMAFPMSAAGMEIVRPDRTEWIHDMSHRQYAMDGSDLDEAARYIIMGYQQARISGHKWSTPMTRPLLKYGIKEYND